MRYASRTGHVLHLSFYSALVASALRARPSHSCPKEQGRRERTKVCLLTAQALSSAPLCALYLRMEVRAW
jgi:hypothetical protein